MSETRVPVKGGVAVPWVVGSEVGASPSERLPRASKDEKHSRKRRLIDENVSVLERAIERLGASVRAGGDARAAKVRERLDGELEFQRARARWMAEAAEATPGQLRQRIGALEAQLSPGEIAYLDVGVPPGFREDRRLLFVLGELALMRYALVTQDPDPEPEAVR